MYKCELIDDGIVRVRVYREGESVSEVLESLENYEWPSGEWRITDTEDE